MPRSWRGGCRDPPCRLEELSFLDELVLRCQMRLQLFAAPAAGLGCHRGPVVLERIAGRTHSWLVRLARALPISWPMVMPHPAWSGLGRSSAVTSRRATSACALAVLVCSLRRSTAAFSRFFFALLR